MGEGGGVCLEEGEALCTAGRGRVYRHTGRRARGCIWLAGLASFSVQCVHDRHRGSASASSIAARPLSLVARLAPCAARADAAVSGPASVQLRAGGSSVQPRVLLMERLHAPGAVGRLENCTLPGCAVSHRPDGLGALPPPSLFGSGVFEPLSQWRRALPLLPLALARPRSDAR